jgi:tryptophan synthase beta subunit
LEAFLEQSRAEGIIPALESTHAVAYLIKHAREMSRESVVIVNLSGRGDKDVQQVAQFLADRRSEEQATTEVPRAEGGSAADVAANGAP